LRILDKLSSFRKRKKEEVVVEVEEKIEPTELEKFCKNDLELYEALKDTMLLDPRKVNMSLKDVISKAKKAEKEKNNLMASIWYKIAGGLAIYEGDVSKVKELFGKYAKLTGKNLKILEMPDKAVKKAQEYYEKYLKIKQKEKIT